MSSGPTALELPWWCEEPAQGSQPPAGCQAGSLRGSSEPSKLLLLQVVIRPLGYRLPEPSCPPAGPKPRGDASTAAAMLPPGAGVCAGRDRCLVSDHCWPAGPTSVPSGLPANTAEAGSCCELLRSGFTPVLVPAAATKRPAWKVCWCCCCPCCCWQCWCVKACAWGVLSAEVSCRPEGVLCMLSPAREPSGAGPDAAKGLVSTAAVCGAWLSKCGVGPWGGSWIQG